MSTETGARAKITTPQRISALLRKAGFQRATERAGGFNSEGYHVRRSLMDTGAVVVNWWADSSVDTDRAKHKMMLGSYADVLAEAGYSAELQRDRLNRPDYLLVAVATASPEAQGEQ